MQKIILITVLFCASASFAQTPFDSFDTTMKSVPLFKSDKPQKFKVNVLNENTPFKYLILDVDSRTLDFYNQKDSLLTTKVLKPNEIKFLSVDPLSKKYPELTPYQFASNTPIQAIDLDGLEMYFAVNGDLIGKFGNSTAIRIVNDKDIAKTIKADVKAKLNITEREYASYKLNSSSLNETLRQITETKNSAQPIGLASVVTSSGTVTQGASQAAYIDARGLLTTPERLPAYTAPTTDADKDGFTIIHSHPLDAFTQNSDGTFSKVPYDDRTVNGYIYNVGNNNKVNPSSVDLTNTSINGNNYNLILVGNVSPIRQTETNPTQSNSPKVLSEGTAGATFYKGSFGNKGFDMTQKALEKVKKEVDKQTPATTPNH